MVLGLAVHVIHVDLVARQDRDRANGLPAGVEHKEPRSLRLHHVLEPLAQKLPDDVG